jgi:hypothetical protein
MTIFAGGSSLVSGITGAGPQLSFALCATAVIAYNTMAATDSRKRAFRACQICHVLSSYAAASIFLGVKTGEPLPSKLSCCFANS